VPNKTVEKGIVNQLAGQLQRLSLDLRGIIGINGCTSTEGGCAKEFGIMRGAIYGRRLRRVNPTLQPQMLALWPCL
jgi:hypothetical protein